MTPIIGIALALIVSSSACVAQGGGICVTNFGAVGDGQTLCTAPIQQAIDAAAQAGGGVVTCPPGTWLTGTIFLKSHVTLRLEPGCTLLGSTNVADYPEKIPAIRSYTDNYTRRSLIYAENLDHIAIEGDGTIDGNGGSFPRKYGPKFDCLRPYLMRIVNCRDVRVEGIFMKDPAMWNQHYLACERVRITGVRVWGFANNNNDGLDIDGCRDVVVSKSFFSSHDDGITLKSTSEHPCQGVVISDCVASSHASPIKMGTESMGGFKDVTIVNCAVMPAPLGAGCFCGQTRGLTGIELIIVDGGQMERVNVSNITIEGYRVPMSVRLGARGRGFIDPDGLPKAQRPERLPVGTVRDISFANILATGADKNCGIMLLGHPGHPLENISLSNITVRNAGGGEAKLASREVPERAYDYPQAAWWGAMPAYGLYARHVKGLNISHVRLQTTASDARQALVVEDVEDAELDGVTCMPGTGTTSLVRVSQSSHVLIRGSRPQFTTGVFLKVEGSGSSGVVLVGNDFSRVARITDRAGDVPAEAVREAGNVEP